MITSPKPQTTEERILFYQKHIAKHEKALELIQPGRYNYQLRVILRDRIGFFNGRVMELRLAQRKGEKQSKLMKIT